MPEWLRFSVSMPTDLMSRQACSGLNVLKLIETEDVETPREADCTTSLVAKPKPDTQHKTRLCGYSAGCAVGV